MAVVCVASCITLRRDAAAADGPPDSRAGVAGETVHADTNAHTLHVFGMSSVGVHDSGSISLRCRVDQCFPCILATYDRSRFAKQRDWSVCCRLRAASNCTGITQQVDIEPGHNYTESSLRHRTTTDVRNKRDQCHMLTTNCSAPTLLSHALWLAYLTCHPDIHNSSHAQRKRPINGDPPIPSLPLRNMAANVASCAPATHAQV